MAIAGTHHTARPDADPGHPAGPSPGQPCSNSCSNPGPHLCASYGPCAPLHHSADANDAARQVPCRASITTAETVQPPQWAWDALLAHPGCGRGGLGCPFPSRLQRGGSFRSLLLYREGTRTAARHMPSTGTKLKATETDTIRATMHRMGGGADGGLRGGDAGDGPSQLAAKDQNAWEPREFRHARFQENTQGNAGRRGKLQCAESIIRFT